MLHKTKTCVSSTSIPIPGLGIYQVVNTGYIYLKKLTEYTTCRLVAGQPERSDVSKRLHAIITYMVNLVFTNDPLATSQALCCQVNSGPAT